MGHFGVPKKFPAPGAVGGSMPGDAAPTDLESLEDPPSMCVAAASILL